MISAILRARGNAAGLLSGAVAPLRSFSGLPASIVQELSGVVDGRLSTKASVLHQHGRDESYHESAPPQAVIYPKSTGEVAAVVRLCHENAIPVIPYGVGTSLEGHVAALHGGVALDMSQMDRVLQVNPLDMDCRVEAGVTRKQLDAELRDSGLFFPVDPGADATLGGMAATRASGTTTVRYGAMRDNVMGLTVVLPDGRVMKTGNRARKSSTGYDLTRLLVGSEGTLGVITEVALRLYGRPEAVSSAVCEFATMQGAVEAVMEVMARSIPVARIELIDELSILAINHYSKTNYTPVPTLFFEFHGSEASVRDQAECVEDLVKDHGGKGFSWAVSPEERKQLWAARHSAYWAAIQTAGEGKLGYPTDVCVPLSELPRCILETQQEVKEAGIHAPLVGHVGDGNFHMLLMIDPTDPAEVSRAKQVVKSMVHRAQALGGTCSGEHGIGYGKLPLLIGEHCRASLDVMHAIKKSMDPLGIMNPGKLGSDPATFALSPVED